ncbi:MAG: nucleoside kinase [Bacteroidales bacterium]|nr:nucleoside kinase [Bacteroidales bacterium]
MKQSKINAARQEYKAWCRAIGVDSLPKLNEVLAEGQGIPLINLCEARQERKYAEIANQIFWRRRKNRIVMMSGPSSSGKTSSSLRIAQQCRVLGINPRVIELDNYFVDREHTPKDANGNYDFECLEAMDVEHLNSDLNDLLAGKEVIIPRFDFKEGRSFMEENRRMKLEANDMLFMEGIHALNPALTPNVDHTKIFDVYISALSAINGGTKLHGSTTDKRLLRRIVRDNRVRGISPEETILRWPSVRHGEMKNIFPYEENAEAVFNSSMLYDVPLLKYYAEPLLYGITESSPAYRKAQDLLHFLSPVTPLKPNEIAAIPPTSIMREFIGGQSL